MIDNILNEVAEKMGKTVTFFKDELKGIRTGRATVTLFDNIKVDYYGNPTPVNQIATLHTPDPRMITIQPWDPKTIPVIEKAILNSTLGFNPSNDGTIIRVPVPTLTEERRQQIVKLVKKMAEDTKVAIRNERRTSNDAIKKLEKDKEIAEDETKKAYEKTQNLTNEIINKIDKITENKKREILEI